MRLLFVTGSLVHGGAERHAITLANRLAERGHECRFAYVKNDPSQLARLRGLAEVRCLHARRYLDWKAAGELRRFAKCHSPDAVVAVNQYALMYARLALRGLGVPLVVTWHTTLLRNAKEWLQMLVYRPLFWSAEQAVFVCQAQRRHWAVRALGAQRNLVIHNGVDLEYWRPRSAPEKATMRRVLGFGANDFVVGMSAVLRREKNPVQLVEAVAQLRGRGIPARALFIGDGDLRGAVAARAQALGIGEAITITGYQEDVRPLVGACDALALCSTAVETFSLAALEAMALGRPVVHAEVGGAAEMIQPGHNGFLYPVGDTAALVERLALLAEPGACERMGTAARAVVEARFSERAMVDRYESLFQDLATRRTKRGNVRKPAGAH